MARMVTAQLLLKMESMIIIWDFRLRILDLGVAALYQYYNRQNSLILKSKFQNLILHLTSIETKKDKDSNVSNFDCGISAAEE
jgi:hypothetical protein